MGSGFQRWQQSNDTIEDFYYTTALPVPLASAAVTDSESLRLRVRVAIVTDTDDALFIPFHCLLFIGVERGDGAERSVEQ